MIQKTMRSLAVFIDNSASESVRSGAAVIAGEGSVGAVKTGTLAALLPTSVDVVRCFFCFECLCRCLLSDLFPPPSSSLTPE
jgi:hypothetical protein